MSRFTLLMLILGIGLALLIFNHQEGQVFGIGNDDFASLVQLSALVVLLSAGILAGRRGPAGEVLRNIAVWLLIALALVAGYVYRNDLHQFAARVTAGLIPGSPVVMTTSEGGNEVVIYRGRGGHFQAQANVNGLTVPMLVDTGASAVVLSHDDALRLGLDPQNLIYSVRVQTANGQALAAPVRLESIAIGPIVRTDIRALVTEDGRLAESLLGMSFLSTLGSLQIQTDMLRLRD
ncbi:TIGR02281 family clan AA aspartic protease [Rhizobium sp. SSA_523]|uniref:TIGR02281 family clan AA aspartic protease n=1 Tax=Rhizobium sp. SSA_523 TaxID=2952477 RepID=UPI002090793D|nr:TIGR02281 family clan AA aspartic protease [Rhizobium sp. SSA_523]MCO5730042.1 TIGR02281 family clan AA aspartic protease [Rhizobium sp. SSA_523]WKC25110.1 TIGR02281 family clan AA aspartic protease [Rhizobium sp. SSA_523]